MGTDLYNDLFPYIFTQKSVRQSYPRSLTGFLSFKNYPLSADTSWPFFFFI